MQSRPRLGQHFLKNQRAIHAIISALAPQRDDTIVEIGPGRGALTIPLTHQCVATGCRVIAIEKDSRFVDQLNSYASVTVKRLNVLEVVKGDALKLINSQTRQLKQWKLVGNIPYYITGKLLRLISELSRKPRLTVVTVQKEVAQRIAAKPPAMNLLAAATQLWATPTILAHLMPKDFTPSPKVNSAIIVLAPKPAADSKFIAQYYAFIKILFTHPRKTIMNNVEPGLTMPRAAIMDILKQHGLAGSERPQHLSLETIILLSKAFPYRPSKSA